MTIAKRLILLLAVPLVALVGLGLFLQLELKNIEDRARFVAEMQIPSLVGIGKVTQTFAKMRIHSRGCIMAPNTQEAAGEIAEFTRYEEEFNRHLGEYAGHWISDERDRQLFEDYRNFSREWIVGAQKAMALWMEGQRNVAIDQIYGSLKKQADRTDQISSEWVHHNEVLAESAAAEAFAGIRATRRKWWLASAGAVLAMGWMAFVTFRRIALPIQALETSVRVVAAGDYAKEVPFTAATDESGGLARSIDLLRQAAGQTQKLLTQTKQQEAEIVAARQKAEEATQMKSMFLANMSHEIRTPMNAIIGLSHLALRTPLSAKQRDYVSKVHNAGTSLLAIINDILDFSKIEAGRIDLEATEFKLDDVISSVTVVTGQKANEKGLEFLAQTAPGIPAVLLGDPLRLGQILTNLVNNAIKFTERGEVHLQATLLEQTGEKCQLRFTVRDTGVGMSPEQSARLFQPFTQADMSTTRKHGGTGLGLTICRRLVELMGGQILLESQPGLGTVFTFTVWLGVGQQKGSGRVLPEKLRQLRTLVVDDNAAAREVIEELLEGIVSRTDVVSSGAEAISAIRQRGAAEPYDVVFMDWRMPGMDGLEAARAIKQDPALSHQPAIVLVTAFGREEVREEAERLELEGFLVKPVTRSMIVDSLVNVFVDPADQGTAVVEATSEGRRLDGMRVLLAEDNEINQQIACELLEGVGARVTVVPNGRDAVTRLTEGGTPSPFDAVLMDLQMPVMGGYEATALIRADARFAALPIIAMTAHATIEERQRCHAAGMNDHVAKPIDPGLLFETLARHHRTARTAPPLARSTTPPSAAATMPAIAGLDTKDGLARVGGNEQFYLKLLRTFRDDQAAVDTRITAALEQGDIATAELLAHSLKGVAGNLGAKLVQAAAGTVEDLLRKKAPAPEIQSAVAELAAVLRPLFAQLPAAPAESPAAAAPAADPAVTRALIEKLARLLEDFDAGATEFIEQNAAFLQPAFAPADWTQFTQYARGYAFAEALALLQATRNPS